MANYSNNPLGEALSHLMGKDCPMDLKGKENFDHLSPLEFQKLQDWASSNCKLKWATGESILQSAVMIVDLAIENGNISI